MKKIIFSAGILALLVGCQANENAEADANTPVEADSAAEAVTVQTACQEPEYRQMDFWVGTWDLTWTQADGSVGQGTNVISRSPFGDCVITEQFDGNPGLKFKGMSVSTYSKPHKLWRQTWVDDQGSYFSLYGGPQADETFHLNMERLNDKGPYSRMVFEDIQPDSLTWRWQGKVKLEDAWTDQWVINYVRR